MKIKNVPVNERPYEKCFSKGPEVLTDAELLAIILRNGTPGMSVYELSREILSLKDSKGSLLSIMRLTKEELMKIKGVGKVKAIQILCICELAKRISTLNAEHDLKFDNPSSIANYYMERMRHLDRENLIVIYLDTKCHFIKDITISTGTVNQSIISSREIFVEALRCNAVQIILIHNHPTGDCKPSRSDILSTEKIIKAGELVGITVIDHIIIGDRNYSSLRELNYIK